MITDNIFNKYVIAINNLQKQERPSEYLNNWILMSLPLLRKTMFILSYYQIFTLDISIHY